MKTQALLKKSVALISLAAAAAMAPARADLVLLGSDYLATVQPTFFTPLGALNPLAGLAIGPGNTDTIVQRQSNCSLSLGVNGSSCTIAIEMVALSLISTTNSLVRVRESPTSASVGQMTIESDGSGTGGTFASFFDVFTELSLDGGTSWAPLTSPLPLTSTIARWTTVEPTLLVDGVMGDQNANRHTDKDSLACPGYLSGNRCVDFYLVGNVTEQHPDGVHTATAATPEPGSLALVAAALAGLGAVTRRRVRRPR